MKKTLTTLCYVMLCGLILLSFGCANKSENISAHLPTKQQAEYKENSEPKLVLASSKQAPIRTMAKVNSTPQEMVAKASTKNSSLKPAKALVATKPTDNKKPVVTVAKAPVDKKATTAVVLKNSPNSKLIASSDKGAVIIPKAKSVIGVRYSYGGTTTKGFDCSGFVQWVYKEVGIKLPRTARDQSRTGVAVKSKKDIQVGDIVAFRHPRIGYHTGIYIGSNKFIHSPRRNKSIRVSDLSTSYFRRNYIGARRVADLGAAEKKAAEKLVAQYRNNR